MRRFTRQSLLIALIGIPAVALPILFMAWRGAVNRSRERQATSADPFRIADNFYYVGTSGASVFLITGPEGHVVLESGYPPGTIGGIARLGFSIKDVKILIASDAHDVADGAAELKKGTGAELWASDASANVIEAGGSDPDFRQPLKFLSGFGALRYPPARVDHRVKDGETIRLGPIAITAHLTPGRTRGCTSWSFPVRDGTRLLTVVSVCNLHRTGGFRYPGQDDDLQRSFGVLRSLPADIWVTSESRAWGRYSKFDESRTAKNPVRPFIDHAGYLAYIDAAEGDLRNGVVQ